jgi:glycosyltransferase involved in cell wall biosynthesis
MVLFLHNRYRTTGGEERTVEDLVWLVREHMSEPAELLARWPISDRSASLPRVRAAAGLLRGGLQPEEVGRAVRLSGARIVHAHNLHPSLGWRALAAGRAAGARIVLHLHQYRLVCAIGVCYTRGAECTRCHGRDTSPGVRLNCRGSLSEAVAYGAALSLWQHRLLEQADALIVPSVFARERLRALGAPLPWDRVHVLAPPVRGLGEQPMDGEPHEGAANGADGLEIERYATSGERASGGDRSSGSYALVVSRLAPEKGVDVAIAACRLAGVPLVVAGDGPELPALRELAGDGDVRFAGRVDDAELVRLRASASIALVPSRSAETFGMAAAEAMAGGLPVAASRVGALPELVDESCLAAPGDASGLAEVIARVLADPAARQRGLERVRAACAPEVVARGLAEVYDEAAGTGAGT